MNIHFQQSNMCKDCFTEQAKDYGCDSDNSCEVWVIAACGHTTCTASQTHAENMSDGESECYTCYLKKIEVEESFADAKEAKAEVKDAPSIKKLLSTVTSESAKSMLTKWVNDHPEAFRKASTLENSAKRKQPPIIMADDHINKRVAKDFDGMMYHGSVDKYDSVHKLWHIRYDDNDDEDMNELELLKVIANSANFDANCTTNPSQEKAMTKSEKKTKSTSAKKNEQQKPKSKMTKK